MAIMVEQFERSSFGVGFEGLKQRNDAGWVNGLEAPPRGLEPRSLG